MATKDTKFNKSDKPLKNISALDKQFLWREYNLSNVFEFVCEVKPNRNKEKLEYEHQVTENMERSCVYAMVISKKIFKIGSALRGIKDRISSYNSGKTIYRLRGTNSVTNYWVLQSLINMGTNIEFYAYYPPTKQGEIFGKKFDEPFPSAKTIEGIILDLFETQYGKSQLVALKDNF